MSIWGSLIGGMVGLSLGGPFGMLLGSIIGGKISRARSGLEILVHLPNLNKFLLYL